MTEVHSFDSFDLNFIQITTFIQFSNRMKPAQRAKSRLAELDQLSQRIEDSSINYQAKLDQRLALGSDAIREFHTSFEMQVNTIAETERLSNLRAEKLEWAVQEVQFYNHLKESISERQKRENVEIARVAENALQAHELAVETERMVQAETGKEQQSERRGKFKNVTNNLVQQGDTTFDTANRTIRLAVERNKETLNLQLRFVPERHKYVVAGECHPKVGALVGQFNFHKDVQRLRRQLVQLLSVL